MSPPPVTPPEATVVVYIFTGPDGKRGHWVQVEGPLSPLVALRLALAALITRLRKRSF